MSSRVRKIVSWLLISIATVAVLFGVVLGAFGFVVGRVPEYRVQVQDWLSKRTGVVVEFRALSARLKLFGPELVFHNAVVRSPDRTRILATAARGSVGFDIWGSLLTGRLTAGRFWLEAPQLALVRTRDGQIRLVGQSLVRESGSTQSFTAERVPTGRFVVEEAVVNFRDEITGRGPWSFSGISFELTRDLDELDLSGSMSLPRGLGGELQFTASARGSLEQPREVLSTFSIRGEHVDLAGWADVFPDDWLTPETGHGSFYVDGRFHGATLTQATARVALDDWVSIAPAWTIPLPIAEPMPVVADDESEDEDGEALTHNQVEAEQSQPALEPATPTAHVVDFERLAFALDLRREAQQWIATITDLDLSRARSPWRAKRIEARWSTAPDQQVHVVGDRVVLQNAWPLLAYLPESERIARARALAARGTLANFDFRFARTPGAAANVSLRADLDAVGFAPVGRVPGLTGLSGRVALDQSKGELTLDSRDPTFTLPRMFRDVLDADRLQASISWERTAQGWKIHSDDLRVSGEDGSATARIVATVPLEGGSPHLSLAAAGTDLRVSSTRKYVPGHKLGPKTLAWFDRAFVDGRVVTATFEMEGTTRDFPFRNGEGRFVATADVEDATLAFQEQWLPATDIRARAEFRNAGMLVRSSGARLGEVVLSEATAEIADFRQNDLRIRATASADVQHALDFLRDSPLAASLGPQFARLRGAGTLASSVDLYLPIQHLEDRQVSVAARFKDATLHARGIDAPVRELNGTLTINDTSVSAAKLHGTWLGGPLSVNVARDSSGLIRANAEGKLQVAQVARAVTLPRALALEGAARWQVSTALPAQNDKVPAPVRIEADLRELAVGLPAPLRKSIGEPRNLQIELVWSDARSLLLRASSADLRGILSLRQEGEGWAVERGGLRADGAAASLPDHRGLRIEGRIDRFVLDDWLALPKSDTPSQRKLSDWLQAANVRIGAFEAFGYRWPEVRGVLQAGENGWRIDVTGPNGTGQLFVPEALEGAQALRIRMDHLTLEKAKSPGGQDSAPVDPRKLPALDVQVAYLQWEARNLGRVHIAAKRSADGLIVERLRIDTTSAQAEARGRWLMTSQGPSSSLNARIDSSDVAATLKALSYDPFIEARGGHISADLHWPGGFDTNVLDRASGTLSVDAKDGQIVNLQPGAGRVLGLFSVAALPRRLALDFSDLTEKGLAFDTIHGDFELRDGHAFTDNLLLRGPAAEIGIAGRTGLGTRDYDQTAIVTGNLGASLPVAGALAGGPAVGAALLLFSQVFKEPLKGITRGYYRITGPWDNPVVERVDASAAKDATARVDAHSSSLAH